MSDSKRIPNDDERTQPVSLPPRRAADDQPTAPVPRASPADAPTSETPDLKGASDLDGESAWDILSKPLIIPPSGVTRPTPPDDDMRTAPIHALDPDVLSKPLIIPPARPTPPDDDMRTAPIHALDLDVLSKPLIIPPARPTPPDDDMRTAPMDKLDSAILSRPARPPANALPPAVPADDNMRTMPMSTAPAMTAPMSTTPVVTTPNVAAPTHLGMPTLAPTPDKRRGWIQTVRRQMQTEFNPYTRWIGVVYSPDIDKLLAQTALEDPDPEVAEQAARTIGRIRSQAAVTEIARRQREGAKGALRTLAVVRDEAASLPDSVAWWARLFAWLTNVWRRLTVASGGITARFLFAALGAGLAFGVYTWVNLPGFSILTPERWSKGISFGLTMGILYGLRAILAGEAPSRMRGFFSWWGIIAWSVIAGVIVGALTWGAFTWLILEYPVEDWGFMAFAGLGGAVGLAITALFRLPGVIAALIDGVSIWLPLYIVWERYWNDATGQTPAFIYFRTFEGVYEQLIPMVVAIALGAHLASMLGGVRQVVRALRRRNIRTGEV
jgi:hypothetical protein